MSQTVQGSRLSVLIESWHVSSRNASHDWCDHKSHDPLDHYWAWILCCDSLFLDHKSNAIIIRRCSKNKLVLILEGSSQIFPLTFLVIQSSGFRYEGGKGVMMSSMMSGILCSEPGCEAQMWTTLGYLRNWYDTSWSEAWSLEEVALEAGVVYYLLVHRSYDSRDWKACLSLLALANSILPIWMPLMLPLCRCIKRCWKAH